MPTAYPATSICTPRHQSTFAHRQKPPRDRDTRLTNTIQLQAEQGPRHRAVNLECALAADIVQAEVKALYCWLEVSMGKGEMAEKKRKMAGAMLMQGSRHPGKASEQLIHLKGCSPYASCEACLQKDRGREQAKVAWYTGVDAS